MAKIMKEGAIFFTTLAIILFILNKYIQLDFLTILLTTFLTTAYHFDMRLVIGTILGESCKNIDPNNSWFQEKRFEKKLYNCLGVRSWKKHIPTYSPASFDPSTLDLSEILKNTCISEVVHVVIVCFSFLPVIVSLLMPFLRDDVIIFIITSLLAASIDSIFVIVQRYNRPRLRKVIERKKP